MRRRVATRSIGTVVMRIRKECQVMKRHITTTSLLSLLVLVAVVASLSYSASVENKLEVFRAGCSNYICTAQNDPCPSDWNPGPCNSGNVGQSCTVCYDSTDDELCITTQESSSCEYDEAHYCESRTGKCKAGVSTYFCQVQLGWTPASKDCGWVHQC